MQKSRLLCSYTWFVPVSGDHRWVQQVHCAEKRSHWGPWGSKSKQAQVLNQGSGRVIQGHSLKSSEKKCMSHTSSSEGLFHFQNEIQVSPSSSPAPSCYLNWLSPLHLSATSRLPASCDLGKLLDFLIFRYWRGSHHVAHQGPHLWCQVPCRAYGVGLTHSLMYLRQIDARTLSYIPGPSELSLIAFPLEIWVFIKDVITILYAIPGTSL